MKNRLVLVLATGLLAVSPATFAQPANATEKTLESKIIALDTQGWQAYKNNDPIWFEKNTTEGFISISSDGTSNKSEVLKSVATDCKVTSFSLTNFKFVMLDKNAVLLTYTATQDAICGGKKAPAHLQVAVNYVNRGGKWLEAMYMQAP
jgi:hypothetical protein